MKVQWQILLFIFCLNLTFGLAIAVAVPGTEYVTPVVQGPNATEYEEHFNATELAEGWDQNPLSGIPIIGDVFAGFSFAWQYMQYLVDGFPMLLGFIRNTYITSSAGIVVFLVLENVLRAIFALLIVTFLIEFMSGRVFTDR